MLVSRSSLSLDLRKPGYNYGRSMMQMVMFGPVYGENNSTRLPMFAQLDLRVDYNIIYPTWILNIYLDIQMRKPWESRGWAYQFDYQARQPQTGYLFCQSSGWRHGKGKRKNDYAQAILLALFSAVAAGCVEGLQEVYELEDTRILGMQANPPEIALTSEGTQVVTVKPFVYLPEGDHYLPPGGLFVLLQPVASWVTDVFLKSAW